jgi:signal transduction histidine kinase
MIISDFTLPQFSTPRALALLQESKLDVLFIIVSGTIGEVRAVESMKAGATNCVLNDHLHRVGPVVQRALREANERAERAVHRIAKDGNHRPSRRRSSARFQQYSERDRSLCRFDDSKDGLGPSVAGRRRANPRCGGTGERTDKATSSLQPVFLNLNEVVKSIDKMLQRLINQNIELKFILGKQIGLIKAGPGQVEQVLMNLVVNACHAMPNGGDLIIETQNVTLDEKYARIKADSSAGNYVMLSCADSGMGMTDEVKARLFEVFFTTKPKGKGTGLGLATCRTILKQWGGHISVHSELGKVSTFEVYFPRVEP